MPTPPGNINATNEHGNTELLRACIADTRGNHTDTIIKLLRQGADPNIADSAGYTPLHYAVMKGNLAVVNVLLQKGANRDAISISGSTPRNLSARAHFFNREIFRALGAQDDPVGGKRRSRTNKKTRKTNKKRHTARRRR
jgi:ankyrin repeat protein